MHYPRTAWRVGVLPRRKPRQERPPPAASANQASLTLDAESRAREVRAEGGRIRRPELQDHRARDSGSHIGPAVRAVPQPGPPPPSPDPLLSARTSLGQFLANEA